MDVGYATWKRARPFRGAALRRLYGDAQGATDFFSQAYQQMAPTQTEELARTLTEMADLQLSIGDIDGADKLLHSAWQRFPGYYAALEVSAQVLTARHTIPKPSTCSASAI